MTAPKCCGMRERCINCPEPERELKPYPGPKPLDCACYCSDRMSGGLPCPPGCCPNVPKPPEGWFPEEEWPGKPKPAPSAEPSWCFGGVMVQLKAIRHALAEAGLAIVPAADVPSAEERKVLEAWALVEGKVLEQQVTKKSRHLSRYRNAIRAELARRDAKEAKTDG